VAARVFTLLLTTTGRKSGKPYTTPLIYGEDGGDYVVVASKGGAPGHPDWYLNLRDNPQVEIQVGPEVLSATARTADAGEKARLWPKMVEIWPDYEAYERKTDRDIPVIVVTPQR
jgi:deazaflavin-dependent oxidoreductase (nitroreductase family)